MRRVRYLIVRPVVGYRAVSSSGRVLRGVKERARCSAGGPIRNASGRCDTVASLETASSFPGISGAAD